MSASVVPVTEEPSPLRFVMERDGSALRIALEGEANIYTAPLMKDQLLKALADNPASEVMELSLSRVREFDTAAVQVLMLLQREAQAQARSLRLLSVSQPVQDLLAIYGLRRDFGEPEVMSL